MPKDIYTYLKAVYKDITAERICDWTSAPKESDKGVLRRLDSAFGFIQDAAHPEIRKEDERINGLLRILERHAFDNEDVNYIIETARYRCYKIKELLYHFMMADYKKFHDDSSSFFSCIFSNINDYTQGIAYKLPKYSKFYRIRNLEKPEWPDQRILFFHVPFTKRYLMGTYRYSIPGYPSFYSASSLYCCWEELDRPNLKDCGCSVFQAERHIPLLDLRWRIQEDELIKKENIEKLKTYILKLPIIIACSLRVQNTPDKFVPEYVISQQIFQWLMSELRTNLRSNPKMGVVGIAYTSTKQELWESLLHQELKDESLMENYALLSYLKEDEEINTYSSGLAEMINVKSPLWFDKRLSPSESIYKTILNKENELIKPKRSNWKNMAKFIK